MIMIDEVHSLLAGTYRQQRVLLNTLRYLANELQISLVCAGTAEAKRALLTDQQLADRFEAMELPAWQNDANLTRLLVSFQAILPLQKPSELTRAEVRQEILRRTHGVTVRIVRLVEFLAVEAIRSGKESIQWSDFSSLDAEAPLLSMETFASL
jgi:Bacterial TniB protein